MATPPAPGSQAALHEANRRRIVQAVRAAGTASQAQLARATGLSAATVSNIVRELRADGTVVADRAPAGGRRAMVVSLSRAAGCAVGVDFGHSHLRVVVGNLAHEVLAEDSLPLDVDASAKHGMAEAQRLIDELLTRVAVPRSRIIGVGMGLPGPVGGQSGAVGPSTILPGWASVQPQAEMERRLGLPVHVDNDANLGLLAEATWGVAQGCTEAAYIKIATGVGAGLLVAGRLYRGAGGTAGELGHITVDERGRVCRCGNRGCLETFVGGPFLVELLRFGQRDLTVRAIVALALDGDVAFRRVVADAGRYLGFGVASLCNLVNPRLVLIGGDLAQAGDLLLQPLREAVERYAIPDAAQLVTVGPGALGERAEALGALALVLRECDRIPFTG